MDYAQPLFEEEELQNYRRTLDGSGPDVLTHNMCRHSNDCLTYQIFRLSCEHEAYVYMYACMYVRTVWIRYVYMYIYIHIYIYT